MILEHTHASLNADKITITAGIQGDSAQSSTQSKSASTSVSVKASGDSYSGSLSANRSDSSSESQTRINSLIQAGNLTSDSDKLTIAGAQVDIDQDVTINTGELTLASLQDTSTSSSKSSGMNAGLGLGGESLASLSSVGGNANSSHSDRAWVREQTRLIGGGNVTITADKTEIKGAALASATVDEQGQLTDQGNLTLITDELLVSDIQDRDKSESEGFNLNTGLSSTGSSTLGLTANGHIKEQTTDATLGNGTIQTRTGDDHDLGHTNRDLNATQEITKDQQTRGLDSSVTVDHRVASADGLRDIREDFEATENHFNDEILGGVKEAFETGEASSFFDVVGRKIDIRNTISQIQDSDKNTTDQLNNSESDAAAKQEGIQNLSNAFSEAADISNQEALVYSDAEDQAKGFHYDSENTFGVNAAYTNMADGSELVETTAHEFTHHRLNEENNNYDRGDKEYAATSDGEYAKELWQQENRKHNRTTGGSGTLWVMQNASSFTTSKNNEIVSSIPNSQRENSSILRSFASSNAGAVAASSAFDPTILSEWPQEQGGGFSVPSSNELIAEALVGYLSLQHETAGLFGLWNPVHTNEDQSTEGSQVIVTEAGTYINVPPENARVDHTETPSTPPIIDSNSGGFSEVTLSLEDLLMLSSSSTQETKRFADGRLRHSNGKYAYDGGPKNRSSNSSHGNTRTPYTEATLYSKFDANGNFEKWGISQDASTRYSGKELAGGRVKEYRRGPRVQILDKERRLVERFPGPKNNEPWAGSRRPK